MPAIVFTVLFPCLAPDYRVLSKTPFMGPLIRLGIVSMPISQLEPTLNGPTKPWIVRMLVAVTNMYIHRTVCSSLTFCFCFQRFLPEMLMIIVRPAALFYTV